MKRRIRKIADSTGSGGRSVDTPAPHILHSQRGPATFICFAVGSEPKAFGHRVENVFCVFSAREEHVDRVDQARGCRLLDRGLQLWLPGARCSVVLRQHGFLGIARAERRER